MSLGEISYKIVARGRNRKVFRKVSKESPDFGSEVRAPTLALGCERHRSTDMEQARTNLANSAVTVTEHPRPRPPPGVSAPRPTQGGDRGVPGHEPAVLQSPVPSGNTCRVHRATGAPAYS